MPAPRRQRGSGGRPSRSETDQNRHSRRRLPKKQKKKPRPSSGGVGRVGEQKKKYSLRDSNPRPKTSALNWRLRPLGQNCEVIGRALVVKPDPDKMGRSQTINLSGRFETPLLSCYGRNARKLTSESVQAASSSICQKKISVASRVYRSASIFTGTAPSSAPRATRSCGRAPRAGRACRR